MSEDDFNLDAWLQVNLPEGPFLADVGFGNLAPTAPLRLSFQIEQDTPHEMTGTFGLTLSDDELAAALDIVARKGAHGAPHPFFA